MRRIIAHRGLPQLAPENTLSAFEKMQDYQIEWFETDVSITKDEQVIIIHDDYLDRTTNQSGPLDQATSEIVDIADAGSWFDPSFKGERIPRLEELITFINQSRMNVNIELKAVTGATGNRLADSLVKQLSDAIQLINPAVKVIVSSFNPLMLLKMKALQPQLEYAVLFENHTIYEDWPLIVDAVGANYVHLESDGLTQSLVKTVIERGYHLNVWTVNTKDRANELFNWGVEGIFTDNAENFVAKKTVVTSYE